jgi:predicted DNA-binding protein (MmcQ/YjbR family)
MTADDFRALALELPEAAEGEHMGHADFRIGGKIFATIGCDQTWGMVKLSPEQQKTFVAAKPKVFEPVKGAWGKSGCTLVHLRAATKSAVTAALAAAFDNVVSKNRPKQRSRTKMPRQR